VTFGHINWDRAVTVHKFGFAWALMAGVAYDLTTHAKLDRGYRYLNLGKVTGVSSALGGPVSSPTTNSHEVRVGIRYVID
jgi:opacity protein-like surface antigen